MRRLLTLCPAAKAISRGFTKRRTAARNWKLQYSGTRKEFFLDALVCAGSVCYALSDPVDAKFVILHTVDGENWKELPSDHMPAALQGEGAFAASGTCLAVRNGREITFVTGGPAARVFHSSDGGGSWTVKKYADCQRQCVVGNFSIALQGRLAVIVGGDYKDASKSDRVAAYSCGSTARTGNCRSSNRADTVRL